MNSVSLSFPSSEKRKAGPTVHQVLGAMLSTHR
jgi:hypothetical protein